MTTVTDLDKLKALLDEWGVPYLDRLPDDGSQGRGIIVGDLGYAGGGGAEIAPSEKVTGYGGFYTAFEFSEDGSFLRMGAWE